MTILYPFLFDFCSHAYDPQIPETSISPTEPPETKIREGYLTCKVVLNKRKFDPTSISFQVAVVDGKKANDRSWKTVYAVLKSKTLYMYKDKKMAVDNLEYEEKPVKLVESEVEVANDYTKRKNVFRVKTDAGSEYLFQVMKKTPNHSYQLYFFLG